MDEINPKAVNIDKISTINPDIKFNRGDHT